MTVANALTASQAKNSLTNHKEWRVEQNYLATEYKFSDFCTAFSFMTRVAFIAEAMAHHPEWHNVYNRVSFKLCTHDAGNSITDKDILLAVAISDTAANFQKP